MRIILETPSLYAKNQEKFINIDTIVSEGDFDTYENEQMRKWIKKAIEKGVRISLYGKNEALITIKNQ